MAEQTIITLHTDGPGLTEFTQMAGYFVEQAHMDTGLLTVFVRHTSCSLLIQENAGPDVQQDLRNYFHRLVPPEMMPPCIG